MPLTRRSLLAGTALTSIACSTRRVAFAPNPPGPRLARVNVSADRVIRTVVGLRPFRPSGFVVRAEKLDAKTVIHNYGHGGAGITLSWGTAQLAMLEAENVKVEPRECAVIGCGVVGLATARLAQLRGYRATIYTKDMPPATTSNIAGGLWDPVTVYDHDVVTPAFSRQFGAAAQFAFRRYQSLAGDRYGVRWLPMYSLTATPHQAPPPESPYTAVDPLYPEARALSGPSNPFPSPNAWHRYSMLIEPAIYLNALIRDFLTAGGRIEVREFAATRDLLSLRESLLFNCTGLGARSLFNDQELTPVRGQLVFLLPQPEVEYMTVGPGDIYMFPRHDGILLGGTHERGNWNLDPDPTTTARILRENGALFSQMRT
jgi:D-amino-acid oxidase